MIFEFYTHVAEVLTSEIEELQWADLDRGQLEYPEHFESLILPAVLINLSEGIGWQSLTQGKQIGEVDVSLKIVVRLPEPIYYNSRISNNNEALQIENVVHQTVYNKMRWQRVGTKSYPASKTYFVVEHFYKASLDYTPNPPLRKPLSDFQTDINIQLKTHI